MLLTNGVLQGLTRLRKKLENLAIAIKIRNINDVRKYAKNTILILAEINIFLNENGNDHKHKYQIHQIEELRNKIIYAFSIDKIQLKKVMINKQGSRLPVAINKSMNKMQKERQKSIAFLTKNGYIENKVETNIISKMGIIIKKLNIISQNIEKLLRI